MEEDKPTYIIGTSGKGKSDLLKSLVLKEIERTVDGQTWIMLTGLTPDKAKAIVELLFEDEGAVFAFGGLGPEDARTMAEEMFKGED